MIRAFKKIEHEMQYKRVLIFQQRKQVQDMVENYKGEPDDVVWKAWYMSILNRSPEHKSMSEERKNKNWMEFLSLYPLPNEIKSHEATVSPYPRRGRRGRASAVPRPLKDKDTDFMNCKLFHFIGPS